ncbi:MAG: D-alanyl-D-alanine carboxypeptidase [Deltaproteobacteria bacterium]|nr:D-alanyl-D-alanine carboxypeptidase [Deltaproteobacteria bacterium]
MKQYLFLIIQLFLFFGFVVPVQAAPIPTLDSPAKYRPRALSKNSVPVDNGLARVVTLGNRGNISNIKARTQSGRTSTSRKAVQLGAINRRITSKTVMILDADSGETIFAKAPDTPRQPASTIKVLTGMIAMKSLKNNEMVGVTRHASRMPRSKIYLDTKKRYKADDLINAVLLASANDASVALAEKIAGSERNFARMMTLRARLWGAKKTICRTANGLTAKGQQSTARDLAQIFRHAMQDKEFARRMKRTKIKTSYGTTLRSHNKALWRVKGAIGGKTGYTNAARQTYVGKFERGEDSIVVAIMGSETMWTDVKRLVDYGFKKKEKMKLAKLAQANTASQRNQVY